MQNLQYLSLPVVRVIDGVGVHAWEHVWREEQEALGALDLREEVLLLVVVHRRRVALLTHQQQVARQRTPLPSTLKKKQHTGLANG